jgi:GTP diphosphokinase / guanosine-3',5'-bis(diphosphate) 3'-diphosphatase
VDLAGRARAFALAAYGSPQELEHPNEVAALVDTDDAELWAAALLHDVVEDTDVVPADIEAEFGPRVAGIVAAMTEDDAIDAYGRRKQEHRHRVREAGRDAARVFVADKLSNARRMRRGQKRVDEKKLAHYRATLETMREAYPDLPLLEELDAELRLRESPARAR